MDFIKNYLILMRLHQWVKNIILFAGIIFGKKLLLFDSLLSVLFGFTLFSLIASSQYIVNDYIDRKQDALHPEKKHRPIASGKIDADIALVSSCIILSLSLVLAYKLNPIFLGISLFYFLFNLLYSKYLKHIVILDVMSISIGFVLRAIAGAVLVNVQFSSWLLLCTFMLSLFWGFSKRRGEILLLDNNAQSHRKILEEYSTEFLNIMLGISATVTIISYVMYTTSQNTIQNFGTDKLIFTIPIVTYAVFRSLYIVYIKNMGHNPSKAILTDYSVLLSGFIWSVMVYILIYTKIFQDLNLFSK
jgi:4-hydroxybenzoate polyprenyltransferase